MSKLVMYRTTNNLHIIGKKKFWKNLFRFKTLVISDPYFVDFVWNSEGQAERIHMNTMKLLYAKNVCLLNKRHILFQVVPDTELINMYEDTLESSKQNKNEEENLL
mgnify:CR=1 FL=1